MRKILFIVALLLPSAVLAQDKCEVFALLAENVMESRQANMDAVELFHIAGSNKPMQAIIKDAYSKPQYSTERYMQRSIARFRNDWYLKCRKAMDK